MGKKSKEQNVSIKALEEAKKDFAKGKKDQSVLEQLDFSIMREASAEAHFLRAQVHRRLGNFTLALQDCENALRLSTQPSMQQQINEVTGDIYHAWGMLTAAMEKYSSCTSDHNDSYKIHKESATETFYDLLLVSKISALRFSFNQLQELSRLGANTNSNKNTPTVNLHIIRHFIQTTINMIINSRPMPVGARALLKTQQHADRFQNKFYKFKELKTAQEFFNISIQETSAALKQAAPDLTYPEKVLAYDPLQLQCLQLLVEFRQQWHAQDNAKKPDHSQAFEAIAAMCELAGDQPHYLKQLTLLEPDARVHDDKHKHNKKIHSEDPVVQEIISHADHGNAVCDYILAYFLRNGLFGLSQSGDLADKYLEKACKKHEPRALFLRMQIDSEQDVETKAKKKDSIESDAVKHGSARVMLLQTANLIGKGTDLRLKGLELGVKQLISTACTELADYYLTLDTPLAWHAEKLYQRAIQLGDIKAHLRYAEFLVANNRKEDAIQQYCFAVYWAEIPAFIELARLLTAESLTFKLPAPDTAALLYMTAYLLGEDQALTGLNVLISAENEEACVNAALLIYDLKGQIEVDSRILKEKLSSFMNKGSGRAAYMLALLNDKACDQIPCLSLAIQNNFDLAWRELTTIANDVNGTYRFDAAHMLARAEVARANYPDAIKWFNLCERGSHPQAIFDYATLYDNGADNFKPDAQKAYNLYSEALSLNIGEAAIRIAKMHKDKRIQVDLVPIYRKGIENNNEAAHLSLLAMVQAGDHSARVTFAELCEFGEEPLIQRNLKQAIETMEELVKESQEPSHLYYLGCLYEKRDMSENQTTIPSVSRQAIDAIKDATLLGHQPALDHLLRLVQTGNHYAEHVYASLLNKEVYGPQEKALRSILPADRGKAIRLYEASYPSITEGLGHIVDIILDDAKTQTIGEAYDTLVRIAEYGDDAAALHLADIHKPYYEIIADKDKEIYFLELSASLGNKSALDTLVEYTEDSDHLAETALGNMHRKGAGVEHNIIKAIQLYQLAQDDVAEAKLQLALLHRNEVDVIDKPLALALFIDLARRGHPAALHNYGEMLENGEVEEASQEKAIVQYTLALSSDYFPSIKALERLAEKHSAESRYQLGMYYKNRGDNAKAYAYFEQSVEVDHPAGAIELARLYENGIEVESDYTEAVSLYKNALELGCELAVTELERLGEDGDNDVRTYVGTYYYSKGNYTKAAEWYQKAVDEDYLLAIHRLGCLYIEGGNGFAQDVSRGVDLLQSNCGSLFAASLAEMAKLHTTGNVVQKDHAKAALLLKTAIEQSSPEYQDKLVELAEHYKVVEAQFYLGELLAAGEFLDENRDRAYHYYQLAADQGLPFACYLTAYYYFEKEQFDTSFNYILKAIKLNYQDARYLFAYHLEHGLGTPENHLEALKHYEKVEGKHLDKALVRRCESYMFGMGYQKSHEKAFKLCVQIQDRELAGETMARLYCNNAVPTDHLAQAVKTFTLSATEYELPYSSFALARATLRGEGTTQDIAAGTEYLSTAIQYDIPEANYTWANMLYNSATEETPTPETIENNRAQAIGFYECAAKADHGRALYELSYCYLLAHGIEQDLTKAEAYARQAALHGYYSEIFDDIFHEGFEHLRPKAAFIERIRQISFAAYSLADFSTIDSMVNFVSQAIEESRNYYLYLYLVRASLLLELYKIDNNKEHLIQAITDVKFATRNNILCGFASTHYILAECYFYQAKYEDAFAAIKKAKLLDFKHHSKYNDLTKRCRIELQKLAQTRSSEARDSKVALENAIEKGKGYLKAKDLLSAETLFKALSKDNPHNAEIQYQLGITMKQLQQPEVALKYFNQALKCDPKHNAAWFALGMTCYGLIKTNSKYQEKIVLARKAYQAFDQVMQVQQFAQIAKSKSAELESFLRSNMQQRTANQPSLRTDANKSTSGSTFFKQANPKQREYQGKKGLPSTAVPK